MQRSIVDSSPAKRTIFPSEEAENGVCRTEYACNRGIVLRRFTAAFPGYAIADLTKDHLDAFLNSKAYLPFPLRAATTTARTASAAIGGATAGFCGN